MRKAGQAEFLNALLYLCVIRQYSVVLCNADCRAERAAIPAGEEAIPIRLPANTHAILTTVWAKSAPRLTRAQ